MGNLTNLGQLVDHFNAYFKQEHCLDFQPFIIDKGLVNGIYGPIRISSNFLPIRLSHNHEEIIGYIAELSPAAHSNYLISERFGKSKSLFLKAANQSVEFQSSVINLDRLCRTVHMLNYLTYIRASRVLFLEVNPQHILSIQKNHGAYFEENILKCGLQTKNIAISVAITNSFFESYYAEIMKGLRNYRQRGYQIALDLNLLLAANDDLKLLIKTLAPNYVRFSASIINTNDFLNTDLFPTLKSLVSFQKSNGGLSILQQVEQKQQFSIADSIECELVQGGYYDRVTEDYLRCL